MSSRCCTARSSMQISGLPALAPPRRRAALAPLTNGSRRAGATLRRQPARAHAGKSLTVDAPTGASEKAVSPPVTVDLPPLTKEAFPADVDLPAAAFNAARPAQALLFAPENVPRGSKVPAIVFGHGFSQPPLNYESTLRKFTSQGWLVIAPTTTIVDIIFKRIETTSWRDKAPAKLQTALILDTLRSIQFLRQQLKDYDISDIMLSGHSMGGATTLVTASKIKDWVKGVAVMAPAVKQTLQSAVNPGIHMDGSPAGTAAAIAFFKDSYPARAPLSILAGTNDLIVPRKEVTDLYTAAATGDKTGGLVLHWLDGSHIGFEDRVDLDFDAGLPIRLLFLVLDFLIYKEEVTRFITGDFSKQREEAQALLVQAFQGALAGPRAGGRVDRGMVEGKPATLAQPAPAEFAALRKQTEERPEDAPWLGSTTLLLSYAAVHSLTLAACLHLLADHGDELSAFSAVGLKALTGLAAGLVYENLVLAAGRFITSKGTKNLPLLDALNDPRFLFHSAAPLLTITGVDLAAKAGVDWARSPLFTALVSLLCSLVVMLSIVRNTLQLETKPTWSAGIFHYTYDDNVGIGGLDFTRIIPVAVTTLLLTILGGAAAVKDPSLWSFAAGPALCLALSAGIIPRTVAPMILTGNAGEVALLASLAFTEYQLL